MNKCIFDEEMARKINEVIDNRDLLAHEWSKDYLLFLDISPTKRLEMLETLLTTLNGYAFFIGKNGLDNVKKEKL